jgi:large subunit ribosomal protein L35
LRARRAGLDKTRVCHHFAHPAELEAAVSADSTMPKMKTKKAAAKRFRVTGTGRVRRPKAGGNHGMQEKSRKRLRRLRQNDMVDKSMQKRAKRLLPYG